MADSTRAESIFGQAIDIADFEKRQDFLVQACDGDVTLQNEVEQLVNDYFRAGEFLERPAAELARSIPETADSDALGSMIGPYQLVEIIGEGGMGTVYLAEQSEPVRRRVALKVIKAGMDTKQVLARFEVERQALAMMEHPNIAKVLDGGSTQSGRPYFVMELVQGAPINRLCDEQRLDTTARLRLFQQVCYAVQHAHQKGIIHRDIKPGNVLVARYDGKPIPKIIDFGVAKATEEKLTEETMFTKFGQIVGTLEYMSPEQARFNHLDIDTRTDIYSLGAILYELLTGEPPFDREQIRVQPLDETLKMIREEDPTSPSSKLNSTKNGSAVAINHRTTMDKLYSTLRGDLDWIVMKAVCKDRNERYETASSFAADIGHYLQGEPTLAHPPSKRYRLQKYWKKHKGFVVATSLVGASLIAGLVGTTLGLLRAKSAEATASRRAEELDTKANELEQVADFQKEIIDSIEPAKAGQWLREAATTELETSLAGAGLSDQDRAELLDDFALVWRHVNATDLAARFVDQTILHTAVLAIDEKFGEQPRIAAKLKESLAQRYRDLGIFDVAIDLQERAHKMIRTEFGEQDRNTLNATSNLGVLLLEAGRVSEAEEVLQSVLREKRQVLGEEDVDTIKSMQHLAGALNKEGKLQEAEEMAREGVELSELMLGNEDSLTLNIKALLGRIVQNQGRLDEAETLIRHAYDQRKRVLGEDDRATLFSLQNLARILIEQGKLAEAEEYCRLCLERFPSRFGEFHPDTIRAYSTMGGLLEQSDPVEAEGFYRKAYDRQRLALGDYDSQTISTLMKLGRLLMGRGKSDEAEVCFRESADKSKLAFGIDDSRTIASMELLSQTLLFQGQREEAADRMKEVIRIRREAQGDDHPSTLMALRKLSVILDGLERKQEAIDCLQECIEAQRRSLNFSHQSGSAGQRTSTEAMYRLATDLNRLGFMLAEEAGGDFEIGKPLFDEADGLIARMIESTVVDDSVLNVWLSDYFYVAADGFQELAEYERAVAAFERSIELNPTQPAPRTAWLAEVYLVHLPAGFQNASRAEHMARLALDQDPEFWNAKYWLAVALYRQDRFEDALSIYEDIYEGFTDQRDLVYFGIALYRSGDFNRAREILQPCYSYSLEASLYLVLAVARMENEVEEEGMDKDVVTKQNVKGFFEFTISQITEDRKVPDKIRQLIEEASAAVEQIPCEDDSTES